MLLLRLRQLLLSFMKVDRNALFKGKQNALREGDLVPGSVLECGSCACGALVGGVDLSVLIRHVEEVLVACARLLFLAKQQRPLKLAFLADLVLALHKLVID